MPDSENIFSNTSSESPLSQLKAISSCPLTAGTADETSTHLILGEL